MFIIWPPGPWMVQVDMGSIMVSYIPMFMCVSVLMKAMPIMSRASKCMV